jgi:hypothetical protein
VQLLNPDATKYTLKNLDASFTAPSSYISTEEQEKQAEEALTLMHQLQPVLQAILDAELKAGNKVISVSTGFPDEGSVSICLTQRFHTRYKTPPQVVYELEKDPHYGYATYITTVQPRHSLLS